jgi:uncharacterized protein (TIGR02217 family)
MSYPVYPSPKGLTWDIVKRALFKTFTEQAASGAEYRTAVQQYAIYEFDLVYSYLTPTDVENVLGLYLASQGSFNPFYFDATDDDTIPSATPAAFGVGDGTTTVFQLLKPTGTYLEPAGGTSNNWGITPGTDNVIYNNGTPVAASAYSASDSGYGSIITFTSAPAAGHVLTWSGVYYYLCRFKDDKLEISELAHLMYEQKGLTLRTVR